MTRVCECGRAEPGVPYRPGVDCGPCWLWVHDRAYRAEHGGDPRGCTPTPPQPPAATCSYLGDPLTHADREAHHKAHHRHWSWCNGPAGKAPRGQPVCPCEGCGPRCSGYAAGEPGQDAGDLVEISPPPARVRTTRPLPAPSPAAPAPAPSQLSGKATAGRPLRWSYGVTTCAKRLGDLLPVTLGSLAAAGFDRPHVFLDGVGPDEAAAWHRNQPSVTVTARYPAVRTVGNWYAALVELYHRDPRADRYALFQDDLEMAAGVRPYLDACPWPGKVYLNLYTVPENTPAGLRQRGYPCGVPHGFEGWYPSNQRGRGAVALVFDAEAALTLLAAPHFVRRARNRCREDKAPDYPHHNLDGGIVEAMAQAGYAEYVHGPSLVQHIGRESSMGSRPQPSAADYRGKGWDARTLLAAV